MSPLPVSPFRRLMVRRERQKVLDVLRDKHDIPLIENPDFGDDPKVLRHPNGYTYPSEPAIDTIRLLARYAYPRHIKQEWAFEQAASAFANKPLETLKLRPKLDDIDAIYAKGIANVNNTTATSGGLLLTLASVGTAFVAVNPVPAALAMTGVATFSHLFWGLNIAGRDGACRHIVHEEARKPLQSHLPDNMRVTPLPTPSLLI